MLLQHLLLPFPLLSWTTNALRFPITSRQNGNSHPYSVSRTTENVDYHFTHIFDQQYTVTLTVNGVPFQACLCSAQFAVVCDTGSPDTWVDPAVQGIDPAGLIHTGKNSSASYVGGESSAGELVLANVSLGPYTVSNQAIMLAPKSSPNPEWFQGILGLTRAFLSETHTLLAKDTPYGDNGRPILHNIFSSLPNQPNYITFLLSRPELGPNPGGVFTISELVSDLSAVTSAPRLAALTNATWTTVLDGVYANGQLLTGHSALRETYINGTHSDIPEEATIATLDTGTSYTRGPQYYVDAIFRDVPGAILTDNADGSNGTGYIIPCDTKINVTLVFGGQKYPIHPIDMLVLNTAPNGTFYCTGAFSYGKMSGLDDWLIGATFLRNVYSLFDYGWDTNPTDGQAYMQLLSVTDEDAAWAEADKLLLERIVAHNAYYTSTRGVTPTTTPLAWTGSTPVISVTAADDQQTYAPFPSVAATHLGEWGTSSAAAGPAPQRTPQQPNSSSSTGSQDLAVAGAVVEDDAGGVKLDSKHLDGLVRDSYVIIGMLARVLVLLLVVVAFSVRANRANKGYREISTSSMPSVKPYGDGYWDRDSATAGSHDDCVSVLR
ncbi:aspartic peptidase domain-containing protein [Trametes polyzona]|nr:aspartic peptidase domain-containing protein [Trametes polyzona]